MLRITVELVPLGIEKHKRKIGEMLIALADVNEINCGDYEGWISSDNWTQMGPQYGKIFSHDRTENVWSLIAKMAKAINTREHTTDPHPESLCARLLLRLSEFKKKRKKK